MSYILDALRKADAQRERDSSRGIHAHPTPPGAGMNSGMPPMWLWGGIGVLVVAAAVGGWYMSRAKSSPAVTSPVAISPAAMRPAAPVIATAPAPIPQLQAPQAAAAPAVAPAPPPPLVGRLPPTTGLHVITPQPRARTEAPQPAAPSAVAAPSTTAAPSSVAGLPPDAPRVAISGGVYSPSPAQRMLIVGGQVFNEGSEIAPGLTIDEIKPRTAVLKFRGARYTVAY
jgi:general secretion pathway protein B